MVARNGYIFWVQMCNGPHNMLDLLGHHAVTCKFGGDVVSWDTFVQTCCLARISATIEAGSGQGHEHRNTRPADVLLPNWVCSKPAAIDFTVVSLLCSTHIVEAGTTTGSAGLSRKKGSMPTMTRSTLSSTGYVSQWLWRYMEHGVRRHRICFLDWLRNFL